MPLPTDIPIRTSRIKLPLGSLFWHEGGKPQSETVVFLHGSWHDSTQWLPLMRHLAPRYHCLAPDLLGFGESWQEGKSPSPYSVALQVEVLHSLLSALRIQRLRLVADSLGAWVAGQYALTYPDQVQSLAVLAPEGVRDRELRGRWRRDRWLVAPWSPLPLILPWLGKAPWVKALRDRRRCLRQSPAACQILFQRRTAAVEGELLQQGLGKLWLPTLVLESAAADPVAHRLTQAWLRLLPNPQHHPLPPADSPLGIDTAACAAALERMATANPPLQLPIHSAT
ncbi:alpha/beta fold hydrolase [Nodosilinea sp. LEGE 07298]|uniref:alpha/beta fold hydrolase n=1 Tax=Nodosilinea sp. LEGE 07298 TaxID=2777970 RepID=UPI0018828394|nr:alpha/beta hydrolase [Nodosilinea sp. LEGE 07298]MBE9111352.1 alpha/beta fold hydrolase [Nodosilinea sp. LEGE 07298]